MLFRSHRLSLRKNPLLFRKGAKRIESKNLSVLYKPASALGFGVLVGRKISNKATVRNKIKRIIYEAIQEILLSFKKNYNILIIAKPNTKNTDKTELKEEIEENLKKIPN